MNWTTKDGRVIDVKDMTDDHLTNAIAMLERRFPAIVVAFKLRPYISPLIDEMSEAAQDAIDMELRYLEEQFDEPQLSAAVQMTLFGDKLVCVYGAMRQELHSRKCDCLA